MTNYYVLIEWPQVQDLMEYDWFREECYLLQAAPWQDHIDSAYFVPKDRLDELNNQVDVESEIISENLQEHREFSPFFTNEQYRKLLYNGHPNNSDQDHAPLVKLYLPFTHCAWLLSEIDPEYPDIAFGLCDLGMGFPELGYVSLRELASINIDDVVVKQDNNFVGQYTMSVYVEAARNQRQVTEDKFALLEANTFLEAKKGIRKQFRGP